MKILKLISIILILSSCNVKYPETTGFYTFDYDGNSYMSLLVNNNFLIEGHITNYKYNRDYILIEQNPVDSICECNIDCFRKMESYDKKSYKRCKEAFEKTLYRQYWVVKKVYGDTLSDEIYKQYFGEIEANTYGPFTKTEYHQKRIELNIPTDFELNIEEE